MDPQRYWSGRLSEFLPGFFGNHPVLAAFHSKAAVILHGSTTLGIDDDFSDLDLWFLETEADLARLDAASPTRFFELELDGKPGHANAESVRAFSERLDACDMPLLSELRRAEVIFDNLGGAQDLVALARQPMREDVSRAFFFYHYVEMRSSHRSADNPMERGDPVAVLLSVSETLAHGLRAALALDGEPYPYPKWLYRAAEASPTGRRLAPSIQRILDDLAADKLRFDGREADNPISQALREMRGILVDAARAKGVDEPWLTRWWHHIDQARDAPKRVRWR